MRLLRLSLACCIVCFVPTIAAVAGETSTPATNTAAADADFMKLADEFFDTLYFPLSPTSATSVGVHAYDGKLEDYSRAGMDRQVAALQSFEQRVAATNAGALGEQVRGDREQLLNTIRSSLLSLQTIRPWEKNPDTYSSGITNSAFVLMERKFAPAPQRLAALIEREHAMPAALQAARRNLKNPPKIYTEIAIEQLPGLIAFFRNDVTAAFKDVADADLQKRFAASNATVIRALDDYEAWLKTDVLPRSKGDFRLGAETYRKKLAFDEMVDTPLDRLIEIDLADLHRNQAEFARVAKELEPDKTPAQVLADLAADHPDRARLLDSFRATFDGLIRFIGDKQIITIPSTVRPILEETPPFMRATTFASMDSPGPYEVSATEAYFNVTLPDPTWNASKIAEFMAQFNYPVISNVAVHEAYPGHYVQSLWMHDVHDRVRKLLSANTNVEGWAHYCEQMMLDAGLAQAVFPNDPRQQKLLKLGQLQDALLRNARFYVGIKLHSGQINIDQAVDFFVKEGYQSREVGVVETKRGTSDPTYLYYTLGKLEILKLRADVEAKQGNAFSLLQFHDSFMRQGFAPIKIVRHAMLQDDSPTL
ncbi:MAG: DUF885 domain-containing protein [Dokdonella sp.]